MLGGVGDLTVWCIAQGVEGVFDAKLDRWAGEDRAGENVREREAFFLVGLAHGRSSRYGAIT